MNRKHSMHEMLDLPNGDICEAFDELYYELCDETNRNDIENHPRWKQLEEELGTTFTMNDLGNYAYLYLK